MGFVGNLSLFAAVKKFTNRLRIDRIIAMVRFAQFFSDSQCIIQTCIITDTAKLITITTWGRDRRIRIDHRSRMRRDNVSGRVCFSLCVCLSCSETSFPVFGYILRISRSSSYIKVIGSRSFRPGSQEQKDQTTVIKYTCDPPSNEKHSEQYEWKII